MEAGTTSPRPRPSRPTASASRAAVALSDMEKAAGAGTPTAYAEPFVSVRSYADAPQDDCTAKFSVSDALQETMERHITFMGTVGGGYVLATLDAPLDVPELTAGSESLGYWHGRMASFLVRPDSPNSRKLRDFAVYGLGASEESRAAVEATWDALSRGEEVADPITLSWEAMPLGGENGRRFTLLDVAVWLAVADAEGEGRSGLAKGIIAAAYARPIYRHRQAHQMPGITTKRIAKAMFTTDKVNRYVWNPAAILENGQKALLGFSDDGSGELDINLANKSDRRAGRVLSASYRIDFTGLRNVDISPGLSPQDQREYEALASLWNEVTEKGGPDVFSLKDVYWAMGGKSNLGTNTRKKLAEGAIRMNGAHISFDNFPETLSYKYPHFKYDGSLLPMELVTGYVDGQLTDGLIHLFREPPLFTFARGRGQFSSFGVEMLQTNLSKTSINVVVENYLREQIAWMRNPHGKRNGKIAFKELYNRVGVTKSRDKTRVRDKASRVLGHYEDKRLIKKYRLVADGYVVSL